MQGALEIIPTKPETPVKGPKDCMARGVRGCQLLVARIVSVLLLLLGAND